MQVVGSQYIASFAENGVFPTKDAFVANEAAHKRGVVNIFPVIFHKHQKIRQKKLADYDFFPIFAYSYRRKIRKINMATVKRLKEEDEETVRQKKFVKDSLTTSLQELRMAQEGKIQLKDARNLFK